MLREDEILRMATNWYMLYLVRHDRFFNDDSVHRNPQPHTICRVRSNAYLDVLGIVAGTPKYAAIHEYCESLFKQLQDKNIHDKASGWLLDWMDKNIDYDYVRGLLS